MKKTIPAVALLVLVLGTGTLIAQDDPIDKAVEACTPEIEAYCSQVTPGEGRMLACFFAHQDKISGKCSWALYEASAALEDFVNAVAYVATECHDDLLEYCGDVQMGEGRVGVCLLEHEEEVSADCRQAMADAEMEMVED